MGLPINIRDLIESRIVENTRIEYKSDWDPEPIVHSITAFANDFDNTGGGYVQTERFLRPTGSMQRVRKWTRTGILFRKNKTKGDCFWKPWEAWADGRPSLPAV